VFENYGEQYNLYSLTVSVEWAVSGCRVFCIYLSYIKKYMQIVGLFKDYAMQGLFDCLDVIECFEYSNQL